MNNISQINIAQPCQQDWDNMTDSHNGRFCGTCTKTVVDFTTMTNEQVLAYLSATQQKTCGRFNQTQYSAINHHLYAANLPSLSLCKRMLLGVTILVAAQYAKAQTAPAKPATEQAPNTAKPTSILLGDTVIYRTITGVVTDIDDKQPLPGATINADGTGIGAISDAAGKFRLNIPTSVSRLMVTALGYNMQYIAIDSRTEANLNIEIKASAAMMGEVIITRPPFVKRVYYRIIIRPIRKIFG